MMIPQIVKFEDSLNRQKSKCVQNIGFTPGKKILHYTLRDIIEKKNSVLPELIFGI